MATFEVLIVEDEPTLRQQLAQTIGMWGYQVRVAADVGSALNLCAAAMPDIALIDLVLPEAHGAQLIDHLHTHNPHLPVLAMTAYASLESAIDALKRGAYDFLLKPVTPPELEAALNRAVAAVQLQRTTEREARLRHVAAVALTLAHEINNPLAFIMGELQLQLESGEPLDSRGLHVCLESARRIAATVRNLTDLTDVAYDQYAGMSLLHLDASR